jgi:tetratricopeptide (TPR) repeat protein
MTKILFALPLFANVVVYAQPTAIYNEPHRDQKNAADRYEERVFGAAHQASTIYLGKTEKMPNPPSDERDKAELVRGKSAARLNMNEAGVLMNEFIRTHEPDPIAAQARTEVGAYYFDKGDYEKALEYFEKAADDASLSNAEISDLKFKTGYAYFTKKKYASAKPYFKEVKAVDKSPNYHQANYYYGLIMFFERNYNEALSAFKVAEQSKQYAAVIPYSNCQLLFAQKKYDEVIKYATPLANDTKLKNLTEINQLIGQSYFEKGDYKAALPFLEKYVSTTSKVTEKDFYQVGFTQYKTGAYKQATQNFEQLHTQKNELGQNALYHLGDCYLKTNNLPYARNAFKEASGMSYSPTIQQTSLFNYAKIAYQMGDDQLALTALKSVPDNSPYHAEANDLIADILGKMTDYQSAIDFIGKMDNPTAKQRAALQRAHYNRGVQQYNKGEIAVAQRHFIASEKEALNLDIKALSRYWLGEIGMRNKDYENALNDFNNFTTIAKTMDDLPDEASLASAHYNMAYIYMSKKNYPQALKFFTRSIEEIDANRSRRTSPKLESEVYPEAVLMAADIHTKQKEYKQANELYNRVIRGKYKQADYAMLQQSKIFSTKEDYVEEMGLLDQLLEKYPNSEYADAAMFRKGEALVLKGASQNEIVSNYTNLLKKYPKSELYNATLLKLGNYYSNLDQKDKALEYYKRVLTNKPTGKEALDARNAIEGVYLNNGDEAGYISYLNTLPEGNSRDIKEDTLTYRAALNLYNKGNYGDAAVKATNYMTKFPKGFNFWDAYSIRADANYNLKNYTEAAKDYDKILLHGADRNYKRNVERAADLFYFQVKDYNKAFNLYNKMAEIADDEGSKTKATKGQLRSAYKTQRYEEVVPLAQKELQRADLDKSELAEYNFYLAKASLEKKNLVAAQDGFLRTIANTDDERAAESRFQVARILHLQKKNTECEDACLNYAGEIPNEYQEWAIRVLMLLSDIYTERNELLNAKVTLGSITENFPNAPADLDKEVKAKIANVERMEKDGSRIITEGETPEPAAPSEPSEPATPQTDPKNEPDPAPTTPPKTTTPKPVTPKPATPKPVTPKPKPKTPVKPKRR